MPKHRSTQRLIGCGILALAGVVSSAAIAGDDQGPPSDVEVNLTTTSSTTNLAPGDSVDATLTVTNHGPYDLPILVLQSQHFVDQVYWTYADCFLITEVEDGDGWYDYIVNWFVANAYVGAEPALLVGEARTCHMQVVLTDRAPLIYTMSFEVAYPLFDDPDPSNDYASIVLQREPLKAEAAPSLGAIAGALLASLICLAGTSALVSRCRLLSSA